MEKFIRYGFEDVVINEKEDIPKSVEIKNDKGEVICSTSIYYLYETNRDGDEI